MRFVIALLVASVSVASAGDLSKEECLDAHSKGQDAKEQGKLSLARKLFLSCAQSSCPSLVQGDCARFADDLGRLQPTLGFAARDGNGNDLPDTTVYLDGTLVVTRIDGEPHDVDPGNHTVRFTNGGKEVVVTVVVGSGEKDRTVVGTFPAPPRPVIQTPAAAVAKQSAPRTTHASAARYAIIGGGLVALAGAAVTFYGYSKVPSNCSLATNQCAAPPGDPTFARASSAAKDIDIGIIAGGVGLTALTAGVIWYVASAKTESRTRVVVTPTSIGLQAAF